MKCLIVSLLVAYLFFNLGAKKSQTEIETKAAKYIDSKQCTPEQQKAIEIVIFGEEQI